MRRLLACVIALCLAPSVPLAQAVHPSVRGTTETFTTFWRELDPTTTSDETRNRLPVYQYVTVKGRDLGLAGLSADVSGFGQLELMKGFAADRGTGDLLFGYVRYVDPDGWARVTAGRQYVYRGAGYGVALDGATVEGFLPWHLQVQAFGGLVSERRFEGTLDRPAAGGRLAWMPWDWGHVGASYYQEWSAGDVDRQNAGADFAFRYFKEVTVDGSFLFDLVGRGLQDLDLTTSVLATRWATFFVHYGLFDPDALLPRTSIFWVFAREMHHELGGGLEVRPFAGLSFWVNWDQYLYGGGDVGYLGKARASYRLPVTLPVTVGVEYDRMQEVDNGYDAVRVFGTGETGFGLRFSAEVQAFLFAEEVRAYDKALSGFGGVGYRFLPGFALDVGAEVNHTPLVTSEVRGLAKLTWDFEGSWEGSR
jgi:hypothetical protein